MKKFDIMDACKASALDFIDTVLLCMKEDKYTDDVIDSCKKYLLDVHEMHYDTDIGEQGENITEYMDDVDEDFKEQMTLLQEQEHKIEKWLKENGYTKEDCVWAGFVPIKGHQGRAMDFEYNGKNVDDLDVNELSAALAENVIDDRFYVRVSTYDVEKVGEEYKNLFCVEVWFDD